MRKSLAVAAAVFATLVVFVGCRNKAPRIPAVPDGPDSVALGDSATYSTSTTDPNRDRIQYIFDWRDDTYDTTGLTKSGDAASAAHLWADEGVYYIRAKAKDERGAYSAGWSDTLRVHVYHDTTTLPNNPPGQPSQPAVAGPLWKDSLLTVTSSATDPDGDSVSIKFYYGDGIPPVWSPLVPSGATVTAQVSYGTRGTKTITAVARDARGDTSELSVPTTIYIQAVNTAPATPAIVALPARGIAGGPYYRFYVFGDDPEGDSLRYQFVFGGTDTVTTGWFANQQTAMDTWQPHGDTGLRTVSVKAIDIGGLESGTDETTFTIVGEGQIIWSMDGDFISSAAMGTVINHGAGWPAVVVGSREDALYLVDAYMGPNEKETFEAPEYQLEAFNSSPGIGTGDVVYIGNANGGFYAVSTAGEPLWYYPYPNPLTGNDFSTTPIVDGNTCYFAGEDRKLHKVVDNGTSYTEDWGGGILLHSEVSSSPALGPDGNVVVCDDSGYVYKVTPAGAVLWTLPTAESLGIISSPAIVADGTIYVGTESGKLLAIRDNAILWSYVIPVVPPVRTSITSSPIVGLDGHIYFAADDGQLYNVDPQTQTVEPGWPKPVSLAPITSTPLLCQDGIFYVADDDNLYALNPDGSIRWQVLLTIPPRRGPSFSFEEQPSPLVDQYGIIYIASENGLFAIAGRTTNGGLAQTAWPMFHHDRRHTGKFGAR